MTDYRSHNSTFGSISNKPYLHTTDLMTSAAIVGSINSTTSLVAAPQDKCSSSSSTTTCIILFRLCVKQFKSVSALWNHINSVHISRQEFPAVSYFSLQDYLICSSLAYHWAYHNHFVQSGCLRSVNDDNSCSCGILLDPAVTLVDVQV